jgi:uncharacterized membrane protein
MKTARLEAFSDGVVAIIITIMVLDLRVPRQANSISDLQPLLAVFISYVLSFVNVGIYWNNHHHMLHMTRRVNGSILWANLHLLFWLSLIPFVTAWMGENHFAAVATAVYGVVLLLAGFAYRLLQGAIIRMQGQDSRLASAIGRDLKGKLALIIYTAAIPLALVSSWIAGSLYVIVAMMWLVPDRRIEKAMV